MRRSNRARRGFYAASLLMFLLAGCAPRGDAPPLTVGGGSVDRNPASVTVQRGQTLSGIALNYHIPMRAIAEANHLSPPYRIETGRTLIIPGAGEARIPAAPVSIAALPPARPEDRPPAARFDVMALPNPAEAPVDRPVPTAPENSSVAAPLPSVPPAREAVGPVTKPASAPTGPPGAPGPLAQPVIPEPPTSGVTATPPTRSSGIFLWPVRGRVLASYGSGADGTHNDGINIAAPKGAAVQAVDSGTVAYTGNELRGYGNLILVKHANGWISAYAHCDLMLVKRGEGVARGQVIARVGSTGNVGEPQLHFELRRGNHAVDPREFLAPLPTATTKDSRSS